MRLRSISTIDWNSLLAWAALRSGLYLVTVNRYLPAHDVAYIIQDSGAKALITSDALESVAVDLAPLISDCPNRLMIGKEVAGWDSYEAALASQSCEPLADERQGEHMPYSSGTTGKPKGIRRELGTRHISEGPELMIRFAPMGLMRTRYISHPHRSTTQRRSLSPIAPKY